MKVKPVWQFQKRRKTTHVNKRIVGLGNEDTLTPISFTFEVAPYTVTYEGDDVWRVSCLSEFHTVSTYKTRGSQDSVRARLEAINARKAERAALTDGQRRRAGQGKRASIPLKNK